MSQYFSTRYVIKKIKQLLKLRNIKHTDSPRTNKNLNARRQKIYMGAEKSLIQPEFKQARATEDFDVHVSYL
jgi:predicted XRE-type DNA-binding protein